MAVVIIRRQANCSALLQQVVIQKDGKIRYRNSNNWTDYIVVVSTGNVIADIVPEKGSRNDDGLYARPLSYMAMTQITSNGISITENNHCRFQGV